MAGCGCNKQLRGPILDLINPLDGTPWYKTPLGIGAIAVGALILGKFLLSSRRPKIYVVKR